jgi:hypothetical protein
MFRLNDPVLEQVFVILGGFAVISFSLIWLQMHCCDRISRREQFTQNVLQKTGRKLVELVRDPPSRKDVLATEAEHLLNTHIEIIDARGRTHHVSTPLKRREKKEVMQRFGL